MLPIFPSLSITFAISPSRILNGPPTLMPYRVQPVRVYERDNLLSFMRFQEGRIYLDKLNASLGTEEFLVQIDVSYLGLNVTHTYSFTVLGGTYQARVHLLSPALPFLPYKMRISVVQLSNPSHVEVAIIFLCPNEYDPC